MEPSDVLCFSAKDTLCRAPGGHRVVLCWLGSSHALWISWIAFWPDFEIVIEESLLSMQAES